MPTIHDFQADPVHTASGVRIVAADWHQMGGTLPVSVGMVLTVNALGEWRAYLGGILRHRSTTEAEDATSIAVWGSRASEALARAAWPSLIQRIESWDLSDSFERSLAAPFLPVRETS